MTDVLGIITARGGSKSIPRKNLVTVCGKSLLSYTCEAARGSKLLTRTVISTDDEEIADAARKEKIEVPFLRPDELARDDASSMDVIRHVLAELAKREQYVPEAVVILQPTSPLRTAAHIDAGIRILLETGADSVIGVKEIPHTSAPPVAMRLENGLLVPPSSKPVGRRQDMETFYAPNGALYILRTRLLSGTSVAPYGDHCRPLVMDKGSSVDIDDAWDVAIAECFMERMQELRA